MRFPFSLTSTLTAYLVKKRLARLQFVVHRVRADS